MRDVRGHGKKKSNGFGTGWNVNPENDSKSMFLNLCETAAR